MPTSTPIKLVPGEIAEMFAQISHSGVITLADRYSLMAAVFDESLTEEARHAVNRLLKAACRGYISFTENRAV